MASRTCSLLSSSIFFPSSVSSFQSIWPSRVVTPAPSWRMATSKEQRVRSEGFRKRSANCFFARVSE